jgi:hypothetical protein
MSKSAYPRLASLADEVRLHSGEGVSSTWPPPGCTVVPVGHPETWGLVSGDLDALPRGEWYVTDLATFTEEVPAAAASILLFAAKKLSGVPGLFAGAIGHWPVIYEVGEGETMRWIHTVLRGTLGGVEQFQHQTNFGTPGDDPDLTEAQCAALAISLATQWQATWNDTTLPGTGTAPWSSLFSSDVVYTEVGVCMQTQTAATDSSGAGGNLSQDAPTEWAPINGVSGLVGTGTISLPYEVSECVTLHTDKRGPSGRGRLYLPPNEVTSIAAGGKFVAGHASAGGLAVGKYFERVTAAEGYVPLVVSRRRLVLTEVNQITVGIIPDSQRRRRWAQLEAPVVAWTKAA